MKRTALILILTLVFALVLSSVCPIFAADAVSETETTAQSENTEKAAPDNSKSIKAISAALVVGLAAAVGTIAMGMAISKSAESIARQPEASGKINSVMMLGLVFIETLIIYALIVAILIIFVL